MSSEETPLPNQVRCPHCDRLCSGAWEYCPDCGGAIEEAATDGGLPTYNDDGTPVDDAPHRCDICDRDFETLAELIGHDHEDGDRDGA